MDTKLLVILFALLAIISSIQTSPTNNNEIVQPNHYYSSTNKQKVYNIGSLQSGKPLAIVLKATDPQNNQYKNKITLSLSSGSQSKDCAFSSYQDLCMLEPLTQSSGKMVIKCESLPCQATWKIIQPELSELKDNQHIQKFYKINEDQNRRMHLTLSCNNVQINDVNNLFRMYSQFQTMQFFNGRQVYIFFPKTGNGHIYFQMKQQFKDCVSIKVYKVPNSISSDTTSDIVWQGATTAYKISDLPNHGFRFDIGFHLIAPLPQGNQVTISLSGEKGGSRSVLRSNTIQILPAYRTFDLSYAVPGVPSDYQNIQLEYTTSLPAILVDFSSAVDEKQLVEATQFSYFDLKKGEKLEYSLQPQKNAKQNENVKIQLLDKNKLKTSKPQCSLKSGCDFEIEALEDVKSSIYLAVGQGKVQETNVQVPQILMLQMGNSNTFTRKMKEGQKIYLKKTVQKNKAYQTLINSGNVMVYMATTKKCPAPGLQCHQQVGSLQRHFVFVPETDDDKQIIFLIQALDKCQVTLTLISQQNQFIKLVDSQPFAYLMDQKQQQIKFFISRSQKTDISFNLVAPVHALDLIVQNGKSFADNQQDAHISSEGFLIFKIDEAPKKQFVIMVRKRQAYQNQYVHFTLIASSKGKQVRIQSGITYYQTLPIYQKHQKNNAEYVFQFDTKQAYVLNFYSHNVKEEDIKIYLYLSASNSWDDKNKIQSLQIEKASDVLQLNEISQSLCSQSGQMSNNCELFMKLQNKMDIEIDIAITLMTRQAIIQMHTGIWQSFALNSVAKTAHFFFQPRLPQKDVNIFFKTSDPTVRLSYRLYAGSYDTINPAEWPFPALNMSPQQSAAHLQFNPARHMSISKAQLKQCWPYCVVLMSITQLTQSHMVGNFSLMVSDSIMQLPQKQKMDITLAQNQQKVYLVDLKYAISKNKDIHFYVYHSIGVTNIYANVYSEKNDRIPDQDSFDFEISENTKISIDQINKIIQDEDMDQHINLYLYMVAIAVSDAKVSVQFSFEEQQSDKIKLLNYETFEKITLPPKKSVLFYTIADQPFQVKVTRDSGFPFLFTVMCKQDFDECTRKIFESDDKGDQILTKVSANTANPCDKCTYFVKLSTEEDPSSFRIHLQSRTSEIQLTQGKPVYDFTEADEANKYMLYAIKDQEVFINIDVTQGQVDVFVTDFHQISMKKKAKELLSFVVPTTKKPHGLLKPLSEQGNQQQPKKDQDKQFEGELVKFMQKHTSASQSILSSFGLSDTFIALHIIVNSADPKKQCIYTISYSSGERQFDLQDGLITDYDLQGNIPATFYYSSTTLGHAYFILSMEKSSLLNQIQVSFKHCEPQDNLIDEDCWQEYSTAKPPIKDKSPEPTIMYALPPYHFFAITLQLPETKQAKATLGINHQEIMLLPFDRQFPFALHSDNTKNIEQQLSFMCEIANPGNIYITIRKCDESSPTFSYTYNYTGFQNNDFFYEMELSQNPKTQIFSKVQPGTLYMKFKTNKQQALLSVKVRFSETKQKHVSITAGNKGLTEYKVVDSSKVELSVRPPTCSDSKCPKKIKYYLMTTTNRQNLYTQLVCPTSFFSSYQALSVPTIQQKQVTPEQGSDGNLHFTFDIPDQISYVGIKVKDDKGNQVYYNPIEVATIWGQLSRTSRSHKWFIFSLFACMIMCLVIFVRRNSRKGYRPIEEQGY